MPIDEIAEQRLKFWARQLNPPTLRPPTTSVIRYREGLPPTPVKCSRCKCLLNRPGWRFIRGRHYCGKCVGEL